VWPLSVSSGGPGFAVAWAGPGARVEVTPLMTTIDPDGGSEIVVPETVMAGPPGASVWVPMMKPPALFAVMVCPAMMRGAAVIWPWAEGLGLRSTVLLPTTTWVWPLEV